MIHSNCCKSIFKRTITHTVIKDHLLKEKDYFLLPEAAWNQLVEWYNLTAASRPLQRMVIESGPYNKIEIYPLKLKLSIHPSTDKLVTVPFSRGHTVGKSAEVTMDT